MKDGVLERGDRSRHQIGRNIKRLEREFAAKGITGEIGKAAKLKPLEYERYLETQIRAFKDRLGEVTVAEFDEWMREGN
jgi:hypothetical protein